MRHLLLISLLLGVTAHRLNAAGSAIWRRVQLNLTEYRTLQVFPSSKLIECLTAATADTDAVLFAEQTGLCSLMSCPKGRLGCQKCRHFNQPDLPPSVWIRASQSRVTCWRTFQHRVDGSLSFNRNWAAYVSGFGQTEHANFWMGLQPLHLLTLDGTRRLRFEFGDWDGNWYWTENPNFTVAGSADNYRVRIGPLDASRSSVPQYNRGSMWNIHNFQFSTPDQDNDVAAVNCASLRSAGWWYGYCNSFNPNGIYYAPPFPPGFDSSYSPLYYFYDGSTTPLDMDYSMQTVECLVEDTP